MNHVSISSLPSSSPTSPARVAQSTGDLSFKDLLIGSIEQVNTMQHDADMAVEAMFTGEDVNPAEVLTAVQKADLAFQLTMQLRNKAMEVYREIRDIQI